MNQYPFYNPYMPPMNNGAHYEAPMCWVTGYDEACSKNVANSTAAIFVNSDPNVNEFYVKSVDSNGRASVSAYVYKPKPTASEQFVTREEFEQLKGMLDGRTTATPTATTATATYTPAIPSESTVQSQGTSNQYDSTVGNEQVAVQPTGYGN